MPIKFDVFSRWTGALQFTAEIDCADDEPRSVKLGLAVKWAFRTGASLVGASLDGARLDGARLDGASLVGARLDGASLVGASLVGASLDGARLDGARLDGARLDGARLDGARLDGARLDGARLDGARLDGASLVGARLVGARLDGASLVGASLDGARLDGASLVGASLDGARLDGARLDGASLDGASLVGASLVGARLDKRTLRSFKADLWMILAGARAEIPGLLAALREGRVNGSAYAGDCACLVGTIANVRRVDVMTLERDVNRPAEQWFLMIREGDKPGDGSGGGFAAAKAIEWIEEFVALDAPASAPEPQAA
ncbi:pentapeptide repeat-containing protein [Bosea sp. ASV33]|uniref:pentapeptide repeat-containing protein n=1 Tax=Bosea sp. ASV33 TaxID=2795106 RepID=UPI0018EA828B|nr:pentapeptide repeat-containing protein [Bosea sp. ASV33]